MIARLDHIPELKIYTHLVQPENVMSPYSSEHGSFSAIAAIAGMAIIIVEMLAAIVVEVNGNAP